MTVCAECNRTFTPHHFNAKLCSAVCKRKRKNRANLQPLHRARGGYTGYGLKQCAICGNIFPPKTSRCKACSDECALKIRRRSKNQWQKAQHQRCKADPSYVLARVLRTSLNKLVERQVLCQKSLHSQQYCRFTVEAFQWHMEALFQPGMTWGNWGEWHVDHIRPLSSFQLTRPDGTEDIDQVLAANSLRNLQPLWARDNLSKHAKWGPQ